MRIVAPLSRATEVRPLAEAGADEFYCGFVPPEWLEKHGSGSVNRRIAGNLADFDELGRVVETAGALDRCVALALNAQHYSDRQVADLVQLAIRFHGLGGGAVIIGDPTVVAAVHAGAPSLDIHISSIAACHNSQAAAFYAGLGARRIILPRAVTLAEAAAMARAQPSLEFEVFGLNDGCLFEEGLCHTIHLPGNLGGPICMDKYDRTTVRWDGADIGVAEAAALADNESDYERWAWFKFGCGFSVTEDGFPYGPCALCALAELAASGVGAVKIVGREANTERKLKSVQMVKAALEQMATADRDDFMRFARNFRGKPELCGDGYMCYYPEILEGLN